MCPGNLHLILDSLAVGGIQWDVSRSCWAGDAPFAPLTLTSILQVLHYVLFPRSWSVGNTPSTHLSFLSMVNTGRWKTQRETKIKEKETKIKKSEVGHLFPWLHSWAEGQKSCPTALVSRFTLFPRLHNLQFANFTLRERLKDMPTI